MSGRDKDATWRTLGTLCRDLDWSRPRLIHELQNGLRYRTIPPGHTIDWHDGEVLRTLDVGASTVQPILGVLNVPGAIGFDAPLLGIEVLPPGDEVPAPSTNAPTASPAPKVTAQGTGATVKDRVVAEAQRMRDDDEIPEGILRKSFASQLARRIGKPKSAGYIRNELEGWGLWPVALIKPTKGRT